MEWHHTSFWKSGRVVCIFLRAPWTVISKFTLTSGSNLQLFYWFFLIPVSVMWHILGAFLEQESEDLDCRTARLWFMYHSEMLQKSLWCILRSCSAVSDSVPRYKGWPLQPLTQMTIIPSLTCVSCCCISEMCNYSFKSVRFMLC